MSTNRKKLYAIAISLLLLLLLIFFLPLGSSRYYAAILLLPAAIITCLLIKRRGAYSIDKGQVLLILGVIGLLYVMLYYLSGLHFGFYSNPYFISPKILLQFVIPTTAIIISIEIIRGVLLAQKEKAVDLLSFFIGVIGEVLISYNIHRISSVNSFMDFMGLTLFPALSGNLLYHFVSKRYGKYPNLVFRIITTLYLYFIPYLPRTPDSLFAVFAIVVPMLAQFFISLLFEKRTKRALQKKQGKLSYIGIVISASIMISIVMLSSCQFRFGALVIATGSMTGELNVGDAVIYEQYNDQIIETGQVVVFKDGDSLIVHRVVDIKHINGQNRYYTKGDANGDMDTGYRRDSDIVGLAQVKLPYLGYPSVWLHRLFS